MLGIGLTRSRAATVLAGARAVASGELPLERLVGAPPEEIDGALTGVRGIGPWIAAYAERWRPWRAYAALHLWASLGG